VGETIDVRVTTLGRAFQGRVARFARSVEMATRTMETEVDVPNPDLVLVPGMYAEATLTLERHEGAIAVPATAVSSMEDKPWVLVVNADHRLERRKISLGMETTDRVEVVAGVREGELVVLGDRSQMKPGQPVSAKEVEGGR
jgi:RND family efflux transporter MFP subunit